MPYIPIVNKHTADILKALNERLEEPRLQRRVILVVVSIALLLDNMLYMVIVPIIPDYLRKIGAWETVREEGSGPPEAPVYLPEPTYPPTASPADSPFFNSSGVTVAPPTPPLRVLGKLIYIGEDSAIGLLFASKAIVQLMVNPFSGAIIDRIGYEMPMVIGLTIMFVSTAVFACGRSYSLLFFARSLQGVGSAFADTSGLAMIADRFTEENERSKALGIALAFISFGCLVAPPFGGLMYDLAGKEVPFIILSLVSLADGFAVLLIMNPANRARLKMDSHSRSGPDGAKPPGTPLWRLLIDPFILVCAGALVMANVSLAFLEPTISKWMMDNMPDVTETQMGMIWLPAFFPHVAGVYLTVRLARDYPHYQWILAAGGLALEGLCCLIVPFATSYWLLMIPISGICFGIALIDTALLPTLGYLVDVRYVSVYGSIYAIADISYSMAYAIGPIIAGGIVDWIGFTALNILIAISNFLYTPVLGMLRNVYDYKPFESEANVLMSDPPAPHYQTYVMQQQEVDGADAFNHVDVRGETIKSYEETKFGPTAVDGHVPGNPFVKQGNGTAMTGVGAGPGAVQHRRCRPGAGGFVSSEDEM